MKTITVDPITRLEGHGKINIFLDDDGNVQKAIFQVPELRGFEAFAIGRPAEDMPQITSRICGVCPTAHHMAATKALDDLFKVTPPPAAKAIRELVNCAFMTEDHALHFYFLGGPDFVLGPSAPPEQRNILGVVGVVGKEIAGQVIDIRRRLRDLMALCAGKPIHPVFGLPGGVAKAIPESERTQIQQLGRDTVKFAQFSLDLFRKIVLGNKDLLELVTGDIYYNETNYMGLVDADNRLNLYDGDVRVVDPAGKERLKFKPQDYAKHIAEHVEEWTYVKFPYLRDVGWRGFVDGPDSGLYRVAPLARLNVADGMATPLAQAEYERLYETFGGKPVHHTLANHWARLIELLYAAERITELADLPELTSPDIRNLDFGIPSEGVGIVEAPRGTLIHHYKSDERGVLTGCNLIVATVGNSAAICMSIDRAAKKLIKNGNVNEGLLNMVEMAFRAYDPCLSCATHALPGEMPLAVEIIDSKGVIVQRLERR
ncbi:MAG: Ni/Fe hydrogenase subunit alpha [Candidatus Eisenbacteria bacterium]|uniref:Ni/Fe hydrogenase subunit alpha n=1 Tax=Eiseniibacteriota bacterium TaxID=2212470 RepID=A0A948W4X7_UNCEI|nr:Ni/Fe hydrogenase subunit alpha [Candidatus Eisenbacteria bacterium]MBU1948189.1 Ni/Fe hydrogenase subunit alpha [Candidatus Eisenbacteria bacterium]MBU2689814.1 Ni/Fe hydrogenase subunit alpha [Candidatus Eisenbacteria bacterium]